MVVVCDRDSKGAGAADVPVPGRDLGAALDWSMPFVWVQPLQISWAWRSEDLRFDKTDDEDAVLIARLTGRLRCYQPEPVDETWGRLRQLGARREQLIVEMG